MRRLLLFLFLFLCILLVAQDTKYSEGGQVSIIDFGSVVIGDGESAKTLPVEILKEGDILQGVTSRVSHPAGLVSIAITTLSAQTISQYRLTRFRVTKDSREMVGKSPVLIFFSVKPGVYQTSAKLERGQYAMVFQNTAHTFEVR